MGSTINELVKWQYHNKKDCKCPHCGCPVTMEYIEDEWLLTSCLKDSEFPFDGKAFCEKNHNTTVNES